MVFVNPSYVRTFFFLSLQNFLHCSGRIVHIIHHGNAVEHVTKLIIKLLHLKLYSILPYNIQLLFWLFKKFLPIPLTLNHTWGLHYFHEALHTLISNEQTALFRGQMPKPPLIDFRHNTKWIAFTRLVACVTNDVLRKWYYAFIAEQKLSGKGQKH